MSNSYKEEQFCTYMKDEEGETKLLAKFVARIIRQTHYVDGKSTETYLTIAGQRPGPAERPDDPPEPIDLPPVQIRSDEFNSSMGWIQPKWGTDAYVAPGYGVRDNLRAAIQLASQPETETIYKHTGWQVINGKPVYLSASGGIGAKGPITSVSVQLPAELQLYDLPTDMSVKPKAAIDATLKLLKLGPPQITWPLIAAIACPLHGPVDFALHLSGKTGTFKSEICSLVQSHYGAGMDARHLPGSWSSTANAIEVQSFVAMNAVYTLDDFLPGTTTWQAKAYQQTADRIIRSQGNQSGRARLSDTSNLQTTYYPRGLILSTGEDIPDGHSVRARLFILELAPGDVSAKALSAAQKVRDLLPYTTMYYCQFLAENPGIAQAVADEAIDLRDANASLGHARTPAAFGRLAASLHAFIDWMGNYVKGSEAAWDAAYKALQLAAASQAQHLETTDPCDIFLAAMRHGFAAGLFHARTVDGGIPKAADLLGWTKTGDADGVPTYKSHGPCIGWISWKTNELFLDANSGMISIRKTTKDLHTSTPVLIKRLKEGNHLTRTDAARQRNTVRVVAEQHTRVVISLRLTEVLDTQEIQQ